jgi:hypothetical protein
VGEFGLWRAVARNGKFKNENEEISLIFDSASNRLADKLKSEIHCPHYIPRWWQ